MELKIRGKSGEAVFFNPIYNIDNKIEFKDSNLFDSEGISYVVDDTNSFVQVLGLGRTVSIKIPDEKKEELINWKKSVVSKLSFYKRIVSGEEELICFPLDLDDFPYLITSKTILDNRMISPKFTKGLEYAFSDDFLKANGLSNLPNFKNYEDMQKRLGWAIVSLKLGNGGRIVKTNLEEILKGVN